MHRSASSRMPTDSRNPAASRRNHRAAAAPPGRRNLTGRARIVYVRPFQWRPRHSMRTCIMPPPRTTRHVARHSRRPSARGTGPTRRAVVRSRGSPAGETRLGAISTGYVTIALRATARGEPGRALRSRFSPARGAAVHAHPVPVQLPRRAAAEERGSTCTLVAHIFDVAHDLHLAPPEELLEAGRGRRTRRRHPRASRPRLHSPPTAGR